MSKVKFLRMLQCAIKEELLQYKGNVDFLYKILLNIPKKWTPRSSSKVQWDNQTFIPSVEYVLAFLMWFWWSIWLVYFCRLFLALTAINQKLMFYWWLGPMRSVEHDILHRMWLNMMWYGHLSSNWQILYTLSQNMYSILYFLLYFLFPFYCPLVVLVELLAFPITSIV